jgi:hypothetical protein
MQDNSATQQPQTPAQKRFYASEQCASARVTLQHMVDDQRFDTDSLYYQQSAFGFIERHLHYLSTHPAANVNGYLSNLKLMTRKRV